MSAKRLLTGAYAALKAGRPAEAESACREALLAEPGSPEATHLVGLIKKQRGDLAEAERWIRRSLQLAPRRPEFHANLANLLRMLGQFAEAERAYRSALAIDPTFRPARLGLVRLLSDAGQHGHAEELVREYLAFDPDDAEMLVALGIAQRGLQKYEPAEESYRAALRSKPGYGTAHHNLGALLAQQGRAEEALRALDDATRAGIRGRELLFNRGRALVALGQFAEAEGALVAAVSCDPLHVESQVALARLRHMRGDRSFARDIVTVAERHPSDIRIAVAVSSLLQAAGRHDEAEAIIEALRSRVGPSPDISAALADIHLVRNRIPQALAEARAAAIARPGITAFQERLAMTLLCAAEGKECLQVVEIQRARAPSDQRWLAYEASARRLLNDDRYRDLYDYERFVQVFELEPPAEWGSSENFNRALVEALVERHRLQAHPLDQSLRAGTQTPRSLLADSHPVIRAFLNSLDGPLREYCAAIGADADHPLLSRNTGHANLFGCWSVRLRRGGYHVNHTHPAGWISSAYYVQVPSEAEDERSRCGWIKFGEPGFTVPGATAEMFLKPRAGRLVLFPSYMWHGTIPIQEDEPRMTIAFDALPSRP